MEIKLQKAIMSAKLNNKAEADLRELKLLVLSLYKRLERMENKKSLLKYIQKFIIFIRDKVKKIKE